MSLKKRILSLASAAALAATGLLAGMSASAIDDSTLLTNQGPFTGSGTYINTTFKSNYYEYDQFEITYKYNSLDADGTYADNEGVTQDVNYADTFDFVVFNTSWGGWEKTIVGQSSTPEIGTEYTATVNISDIEAKLSSGSPYGINLQTGAIGDTSVTVVSLKLKSSGTYTQQSFTANGTWVKSADDNSMTVTPASAAVVNANAYNIEFTAVNFSAWTNPTVKVTATYASAPSTYVQAEILVPTGALDDDGNEVYEAVDSNYIKPAAGEYTFATEIPTTVTKFLVCYDGATVTKVEVFDNTEGNVTTSVTGKTATEVASAMQPCWNLGNSLEAVDGDSTSATYGQVGEKFWGNPKTTKLLIQAVKNAGFNSIRIPVSYMNKINSNNTVDTAYLARIKQVVDYAYDMGMYVVIDMHNDGGYNIHNMWLDITKTGGEFTAIQTKFSAVWSNIATYFANYDQRLIFEGFNELMNGDYSSVPTQAQYDNINDLNTAFVSAVRNAGGNNTDRVLIVAGYNTNIAYTIAGFTKPADTGAANRLMLSVHYYDPDDFALKENGTSSWNADTEKAAIQTAINNIATFAAGKNMPVFIGEYGPIDKNNITARASYCYWLNYYAGYAGNVVTAYWDNGFTTTNGSGLFDRINNAVTTDGTTIISNIKNGFTVGKNAASGGDL